MSLSSSLYTGVSGLKGHGQKMGVIGNNISNVNTVGFKGSRLHFEDFISQDVNTSAGVGQVGRGVATGAIMADFQQGALETTNEATDVAIGGDGFFVVSPKNSEQQFFTRAGNFRFDKDGFLVDPHGNAVQGWSVRQDTDGGIADDDQVLAAASGVQIQGVPTDIRLENFQSPPEATRQVEMMVNLDSNSVERSRSFPRRAEEEMGSFAVLYQVGGDELFLDPGDDRLKYADGTAYTVEVGGNNYELEWDGDEFILVGAGPLDEDPASEHGVDVSINQGFLTYEIDGTQVYLRSDDENRLIDDEGNPYTVDVGGNNYELEWDGDEFILVGAGPLDGDPASEHGVNVLQPYPFFSMFNNWDANQDVPLGDARYAYQSTIKVYDANGSSYNLTTYFDPVRDPDVIAGSGGNRQWEYMVTVNPINDNREGMEGAKSQGVLMTGSLTFNAAGDIIGQSAFTLDEDGLGNPDNLASWVPADFSQNGYPVFTANFLGEDNASYTGADNARNIEMNFGLRNRTGSWNVNPDTFNANMIGTDPGNLPNFIDTERSALSTTHYSSASTTLFQTQDGYTSGFLQNISIDRDGVLTGRYSNGQVLDLYALTLADFNNQWGLRREGGNLFTETRSSGPAITGLAGTGSLGSISANSLEMSNVDLATEFVKMITTEKGFQANSKIITTTDQMLNVLIQMKR